MNARGLLLYKACDPTISREAEAKLRSAERYLREAPFRFVNVYIQQVYAERWMRKELERHARAGAIVVHDSVMYL